MIRLIVVCGPEELAVTDPQVPRLFLTVMMDSFTSDVVSFLILATLFACLSSSMHIGLPRGLSGM